MYVQKQIHQLCRLTTTYIYLHANMASSMSTYTLYILYVYVGTDAITALPPYSNLAMTDQLNPTNSKWQTGNKKSAAHHLGAQSCPVQKRIQQQTGSPG